MTQDLALSTIQTLRTARVKSIDFHRQNPWVIQGLFSGELVLYDWALGKTLKTVTVCNRPLRAARFIPRTNFLVVGADDGILRMYEAGSLQKRAEVTAHSDCIRCIEIHPTSDETVLFTGSDDGVIRVWSLNSQATSFQLEQEMHGHTHFVMSLCIDPAGLKLISGSMDSTIKAWDTSRLISMKSFRVKPTIVPDAPAIGVLQLHRNSGGFDFDSEEHGSLSSYATMAAQGFTRAIDTVLKRGKNDGANSFDDPETLMPRSTAVPLFTLFGHEQGVNSVCWCESRDSDVTSNPYYTGGLQYITSGSDDTSIRIWDTHSRTVVREFNHHNACVSSVCYVIGSSYLLAVSEDNNLSIINMTSMTLERTMCYSMGRIWTIAYSSEISGIYAALGCDQGLIVVKVTESLLTYAAYKSALLGSQRYFFAIAGHVSPNGNIIPGQYSGVSCCTLTDTLKQLEWKTISQAETGSFVKSLLYSPNGRFLAVICEKSYTLISIMTLKKKLSGSCYTIAFATDCHPEYFIYKDGDIKVDLNKVLSSDRSDEGVYALVDEKRRRLEVHSLGKDNAELCSLGLMYAVRNLASGPLLAVLTEDTVVLLDWSRNMKFVCQINVVAVSVVWSSAGDILTIIAATQTYVLGVNWTYISVNMDNPQVYSEEDGLLDAVTLLHTIDGEVRSLSFSTDGESILYCGGDQSSRLLENSDSLVYQISIKELITSLSPSKDNDNITVTPTAIVIEGTSKVLEIALVRPLNELVKGAGNLKNDQIIVLGISNHSGLGSQSFGSLTLICAKLDNCMTKVKQLISEKKLDEALALTSRLDENIFPAATQLIKAGLTYEEVEGVLKSTEHKRMLASHAGRVDILLNLFSEAPDYHNTEARRRMAELAFRNGYIDDAYNLYKIVEDYSMCLLCAYVIGDTAKLEELVILTNDTALQYRIACVLGDNKLAYRALEGGIDTEDKGTGNPILKYLFADNHKEVTDTSVLLKEACDYLQKSGRLVTLCE